MKLVLDTSALLSLAAGQVLDTAAATFECVVPGRVQAEIRGLSTHADAEGNLAKRILDFLGTEIAVVAASKAARAGELECACLASDLAEVAFLITDDTSALRRLEKACAKPVRFSPLILYALCLNQTLTKTQARQALERMRVKRNWKDNVIFEHALLQLNQLP